MSHIHLSSPANAKQVLFIVTSPSNWLRINPSRYQVSNLELNFKVVFVSSFTSRKFNSFRYVAIYQMAWIVFSDIGHVSVLRKKRWDSLQLHCWWKRKIYSKCGSDVQQIYSQHYCQNSRDSGEKKMNKIKTICIKNDVPRIIFFGFEVNKANI